MVLKRYQIERNAPCPCGSGAKFKKCCQNTYRTLPWEKAFDLYNAKNYNEAEVAFRAWLTQYVIWHNEHTVPFHKARPTEAEDLLVVDIEALASIVESVSKCMYHQGKIEGIDRFLIKVSRIIEDPRYNFYIASIRAISFAVKGDFDRASNVLTSISNDIVFTIPHSELGLEHLNVYIDLMWQHISFSTSIRILDIILANSKDEYQLLECGVLKTLVQYIWSDVTSAKATLSEVQRRYDGSHKELKVDNFLLISLTAKLYEVKSFISNDRFDILASIANYTKLISMSQDDRKSLAHKYQRIGQLYSSLGEYESAFEYLEKSYDLAHTTEAALDLARIFAMRGNCEKAMSYLDKVDLNNIDDNLKVDYHAAMADIALNKEDHELARRIVDGMKGLNIAFPIFRDLANSIRIALFDMMTSKESPKTLLLKIREAISKYIILKPNIFGIGIDINAMIATKDPREFKKERRS